MRCQSILGYRVAAETVESCIDQISAWLSSGERRRFYACINPHSAMVAESDPVFRKALLSAHLLTPDGVGILLGSRIMGCRIRYRVTGSDIFHGLCRRLNENMIRRYRLFFLGASQDALSRIEANLKKDYPNLVLAGAYSPPYKSEFSAADSNSMIREINAVSPDVLWVGMTAPKQEKWITQHLADLDVGFAGAIGAVFDFYSGRVKRSNPVFQEVGLEWLHRFSQEPGRLWRRNLISNPQFLAKMIATRVVNGKTRPPMEYRGAGDRRSNAH